VGRGRQREKREEEGKKGKGRDRKRRSNLSLSKNIPEAPTLQFITKLVYGWKASRLNGQFVPNFTAFIFNTSLTKYFHSKLKRPMGPNCL